MRRIEYTHDCDRTGIPSGPRLYSSSFQVPVKIAVEIASPGEDEYGVAEVNITCGTCGKVIDQVRRPRPPPYYFRHSVSKDCPGRGQVVAVLDRASPIVLPRCSSCGAIYYELDEPTSGGPVTGPHGSRR